MSKIFIDTNILYNILFKTKLTDRARKLLEEFEDRSFYTGLIVVNELLYISTAKYYRQRGTAKGPLSLRKIIAKQGYPSHIVSKIKSLLEELEVKVVNEIATYDELLETAAKLRLLPSDAAIALTCRHYGIDTILTFDEDFERVPWLKVIL